MKTVFKTIAAIAALGFVAACTAEAADPAPPQQGWGPGWRHEQMVKAIKDGSFVPGSGPMMGGAWGPGQGFGPGQGRGYMAAAIGPDGKIDPAKLPANCPLRQSLEQTK
ncbi:MAG: hypothetical protein HY055_10360 [Magnetospirillum sp.]|nr:hypothetical protein [Magnetospirillum sp.]